ncbi:hypothetical protein LY76DRAFT_117206 [Colletotrichum caudatum]|nr:hypothetical protein LY76DRAFT_117206 [Colletotrichum caudatum]
MYLPETARRPHFELNELFSSKSWSVSTKTRERHHDRNLENGLEKKEHFAFSDMHDETNYLLGITLGCEGCVQSRLSGPLQHARCNGDWCAPY